MFQLLPVSSGAARARRWRPPRAAAWAAKKNARGRRSGSAAASCRDVLISQRAPSGLGHLPAQEGGWHRFGTAAGLRLRRRSPTPTVRRGSPAPADWGTNCSRSPIAPATRYCVAAGGACQYEAGNVELDQGEAEKQVAIDAGYVAMSTPIIRDRLKRAGVRLAHVLDDAFADRAAVEPAAARELPSAGVLSARLVAGSR